MSDIRSLDDASEPEQPQGIAEEYDGLPPLVIEPVNSSQNRTVVEVECHNNDVEMREESPDPLEVEVFSPKRGATLVTRKSFDEENSNSHEQFSSPQNGVFEIPCILIFDSLRTISRSKTATVLRE